MTKSNLNELMRYIEEYKGNKVYISIENEYLRLQNIIDNLEFFIDENIININDNYLEMILNINDCDIYKCNSIEMNGYKIICDKYIIYLENT